MYQLSCTVFGPSRFYTSRIDRIRGFFPSLLYELLSSGFGPRQLVHGIRNSTLFNPKNGEYYMMSIELEEQTPEGSKRIKDYNSQMVVFNNKTPFSESALEKLARDTIKTKEGVPSGRLSLDEDPVFKVEYVPIDPDLFDDFVRLVS